MNKVEIKLTATQNVDGKNKRVETGVVLSVPVYTMEELIAHGKEAADWAQNAIQSACLAKARNAGEQSKVHTSIDELIAEAERSGEALKLHSAFCTAFAAFLNTHMANKKQAVRDTLAGMARNKNILATSSEVRRTALADALTAFVEGASAEVVGQYSRILDGLLAACNGEAVDDADFE